jgi:hypothetical protein
MKTIIENVKKAALLVILIFGLSAMVSAQTKTAVKVTDLQKGITDNITKNYAGYTIKDAFKVETNKVITYDVDVVKGAKNMCLSYDNSGKFLNVMEPKAKTMAGNKTKSTPKTNAKTNSKTNNKTKEKSTSSVNGKMKPMGKKSIVG